MKKIYLILALILGLGFSGFSQDFCSTAVSVTSGTYSTTINTGTFGGAGGGLGSYNAAWYAFVPTCDGVLNVNSCFGGSDTRLYIYDGSSGCPSTGFSSDAYNDDFCDLGSGNAWASEIDNFPVTAGTTYYIEWDDRWSAGPFNWTLTFVASGVTGVSATPTTIDAMIDWNPAGAETNWTVEFGPTGFTPGTGTFYNVTVASDTILDGLTPATTYDYYIAAGASPCFVGPFTFTTVATCPDPSALNIIGQNADSLFLSWTNGGSESEWEVEYGPAGFTPGTGTSHFTGNNPDTTTGLSPNMFYDIYVKAVCGVGDSSGWVGPISFNTYFQGAFVEFDNSCGPMFNDISGTGISTGLTDDGEIGVTLPFTLLYQGIQVNDITIGNNGGIEFGTLTASIGFGDNMSFANDGIYPFWDDLDDEEGDVYYQTIGSSPNQQFIVQWDHRPHWSGVVGQSITFQIVIDEATNEIYFLYEDTQFGGSQSSLDNGADAYIGIAGPQDLEVAALSPYLANESCIHFYYTDCPKPSFLVDTYVTHDSIGFSWVIGNSETQWQVEYGPTGFTPGTGTTFTTNGTLDTIGGLNQLTYYDIYVTAICAVGDSSATVGPLTVMTAPICAGPTGITVDFALNDSAGVSWTANGTATTWHLQYGPSGFNIGSGTTMTTTNTSDTLYGLMPGLVYDVYVQSDCGGPDTSLWEGPVQILVPIANDTVCGSVTLALDGVTYYYNNLGATNTGEPGTTPQNTIWFDFVAPASGAVRIGTCGSTFDTELQVFSASSCNGVMTSLGYADGNPFTNCSGSSPAGIELCGLTPGVTYYMWVGPYFSGTFGIIPIFAEEIPYPEAGTGLTVDACENSTAFDLFTTISGNVTTNGQWYLNAPTSGNQITSSVNLNGASGSYDFYYIDMTVCDADTSMSTLNVVSLPNVGVGSTITAGCNYGSVSLFDGLSGTVDLGGIWYDDSSNALTGSLLTFDGEPAGTYTYNYVVDNGVCPADTATVMVDVIDCTGIEENGLNVVVYPNPVHDMVYVKLANSDNNITVQLYDITGQIVSVQINKLANVATLNLSELADGVYFIKVTDGDNVQDVKIVKQ